MKKGNRLEAFEKMYDAVHKNYNDVVEKMSRLKAEGKEKSATYRQLMGNKLQYQSIISMYDVYGITEAKEEPVAKENADAILDCYFKSIIDQDRAAIVICDLDHKIIYMNPSAIKNYEKKGGKELVGSNLLACHNEASCEKINQVVSWFAEDESHNIIYTYHNEKQNKDVYMVALRDGGKLIGYYEKHEYRDAELIQRYDFG